MLHIAPEQCFHGIFRKMKNLDYTTGDLVSPIADLHFDLHNIPLESNTYDVVFCNHVLEHVQDDARCMSELARVLAPGGLAIMQVPIDYSRETTLEDPSIVTPEDREKYYWQKDHMRLFGRDYPSRLEAAGFSVTPFAVKDKYSDAQINKFRLQEGEILYVCTKK